MLDEDLDDSALFCKTLKRKAIGNVNPKNSKQLKLQFSQFSSKTNQPDEGKQVEPATNDKSVEEKIRQTKTQDWNSKLDESRSSYFSVKKSLNTCPLCLKSFKSDSAYSAHMKQCAKTHKMTTKQLLDALELQKKQMQERRDLGLCSQKPSPPMKTTSKRKKEIAAEPYDLALGLALSKSLSEPKPVPEATKSHSSQTLEEFGFTSRNAFCGPSIKRKEIDKKSILKERTGEERQRIIIEKVAVILLDENQGPESKYKKPSPNVRLANVQVPQLWNMGENNERRGWYVERIKRLVFADEEITEERETSTISENIGEEISKLNLPRGEITKDWNKMINSEKLSDFTGKSKDCRDVYFHSVVLFARCPKLLDKDCQSIFLKFNLSTIVILMEYIYCGTLNGLIRTEVENLFNLATEFNYDELIKILNCLKNNLSMGEDIRISNSQPENLTLEIKQPETVRPENKKPDILEDRDLFDVVDLTQDDHEAVHEKVRESLSENETNSEKSFWSFIQNEKNIQELEKEKTVRNEKKIQQMNVSNEEDTNLKSKTNSDKTNGLQRNLSNDSATRDLDYGLKKTDTKMSSDCVILSSGSDSRTQDNLVKPQTPSRTPSPPNNVDYEVPYFDPYDNFHCFTEEQFSPVAMHSQSLITGDLSMESLKSSDGPQDIPVLLDESQQEEPKKAVAYCSTPVTVRRSAKIKSTTNNALERSRKKKRCDLSANRIIRKSLGLQQKGRISSSAKKLNSKKKESRQDRDLAEVLANSILHELSKSSVFQSSPTSRKMFMEMTPVSNREELFDDVTPSPNYSNMGESLLKFLQEQLTKYGLKRNLAKSKAKKILRHIYEELHPLYNTKTGKIVKKIPSNTPKAGKKSKSKDNTNKNSKIKSKSIAAEKSKPVKKQKIQSNSSKESEAVSDLSALSIDRLSDYDSNESEFENLSDTLTQSTPSNPIDLPSAFSDFLQNNPEFHQKILLYEPIWLEDLQKKLKETFKKHYKISDLMDFLDQQCITFRSEAQAKNLQKRYEKKKETAKKKKNRSS